MPEINIEEKIQEALKKKSFKENKLEYLGLALIFCLMLFTTFVVCYFLPVISIFVFLFVDIPLIMGFKHFIWFGPASGETLIDGFRVSLLCGYLNFVSYLKIFVTSNIKALIAGVATMILSTVAGSFILEAVFADQFSVILQAAGEDYQALVELVFENEEIINGILIVEAASLILSLLAFYVVKLNRALLPYVSFLRLTNLEGKSMEGVIGHTSRILKNKRWNYYAWATIYHLLYLLPIGAGVGIFFLMSSNPVYSPITVELITSLVIFIFAFPAVLFVELNNRRYCIEANQEYLKEHKKMLNDAMNDLNKNVKR